MKRLIIINAVLVIVILTGICVVQAMATKKATTVKVENNSVRILKLQQENAEDMQLLNRLKRLRLEVNTRIIGRNAVIIELKKQDAML